MVPDPRQRLALALDLDDLVAALRLAARLRPWFGVAKVGLELFGAAGPEAVEALLDEGYRVFLDLKLHDIGHTVARGVKSLSRLGASFLTVHAYPQTMQAAVEAREGDLRILAVTVLTSYNDADLKAAGYGVSVRELAASRAAQARALGVDGLICSVEEAATLRALAGPKMMLVTPGIRPLGAESGDQKRVATPAAAVAAGADYLVVGRPIIAARDPKTAAQAIIEEMARQAAEER